MFSVDLPRDGVGANEVTQDVVRIVASNDADCVVDHPILLDRRLPLGTTVGEGEQVSTGLWQVAAGASDADGRGVVTITTAQGQQLLRLWLTGGGPCTLHAEVASGLQAWGLGQCFAATGSRADWVGRRRNVVDANVNDKYRPYGHGTQTYEAGIEGYLQIPVLMVAGGPQPFALVLDYVFRIEADFQANPWSFQLGSDVGIRPTFPVRVYVVGGSTALDVRRRVMDLLGRPPVPPRAAFGLWVSEYGYENWSDVDRVIAGLRSGGYPFDGIVLDLFWFGGIAQTGKSTSDMGNLTWDISDDPGFDDPFFPDPQGRLADYARAHIGFALIEESYVLDSTGTFGQLQDAVPGAYVRVGPAVLRLNKEFFGEGAAMFDWSNPDVGRWLHANRRKPFMLDYGVRVHWTDLGEPEIFHPDAEYAGHDLDGDGSLRRRHADIANVYNLFWHRSIDDGYHSDPEDADQRRLLLTRAATAGMQRHGAAIWSGDTSSRMEVLVSQVHNQAHLSCSGIDYYGSDVGGFHRTALRDVRLLDELYTQWFANSAWFDVPLRPHVNNHDFYVNRAENTPDGPGRNRVAPNEVGHRRSNLANLRTRYELIPYYYSLAHRAARTGEPLCPPPGLAYPDEALLGAAHQKLLGTGLMVAVVAGHGEYARRVYLPQGRWYDFWNGTAVDSAGEWVGFVPEYRDGVFRLPAFARGGAVIPLMHVDGGTLDSGGHRDVGERFDDLVLRVYDGGAGALESSFTVYEDGGVSRSQAPREIVVVHRREADAVVVEVPAASTVPGLSDVRPLRIDLVSDQVISDVEGDGASLPRLPTASRSRPGWAVDAAQRAVRACLPDARVDQTHVVRFATSGPTPPESSVLLVCDHADTTWGEDVYARFVTPVQSTRGPLTEARLDPSVTFAYLYPPPPGHPTGPVWTLLLDHLHPDQEVRFTLEKRRGSDVVHANPHELFRSCGSGGYVGEIRGNLY